MRNPPAWVPCDYCDEFICNIHGNHACDCDCPPIEDWDTDPYTTPLTNEEINSILARKDK